jgi:hypothetical protein
MSSDETARQCSTCQHWSTVGMDRARQCLHPDLKRTSKPQNWVSDVLPGYPVKLPLPPLPPVAVDERQDCCGTLVMTTDMTVCSAWTERSEDWLKFRLER